VASDDALTRDELQQLTHEELLDVVDDMLEDWEHANRFLNTQATAFGWCYEYEDRIERYNPEFKVLKLRGRPGQRISVRQAFSARRGIMGHIMSTFEKYGIDMPEVAWGGVVRDHKALEAAHDQLLDKLNPDT
jgi:hypothetical protein